MSARELLSQQLKSSKQVTKLVSVVIQRIEHSVLYTKQLSADSVATLYALRPYQYFALLSEDSREFPHSLVTFSLGENFSLRLSGRSN